MTYSSRGGMRWHLAFAKDTTATHFVYDSYIYLTDPSQVANIELDMNQVMANGKTVIFGTQCSGYSKTWEYTVRRADLIGCGPISPATRRHGPPTHGTTSRLPHTETTTGS